jgi:hypothetical protein
MKKREITIPTILGLLVALGGLLSGLWLVQIQVRKSIQASTEETPQEVKVSNVADTSFTVSWVTTKAVSGFIQYGEGQSEQNIIVTDDRDQQKGAVGDYFTHLITAKGLKPGTVYSFDIGSGNKTYDSVGVPYQVKTGLRIDSQPTADVAYGQVVTDGGEPAEGALVYLTIPGGGLGATLVKPSGSWVIPLSTIRSSDPVNFVKYDKKTTQMEISVNGGIMGKSEVTMFTEDDSPVPEIVLGQNYNYVLNRPKPEAASESGSLAEQAASKISLSPGLNVLTPKSGEKTNSQRPEIIGTAPAGSEVTIEINSDEVITGKVTADGQGNFSFSVPNDLPPGEHTLTVTSMVDGVIKSVTRVFTVYAAGESNAPAYSATPSATVTPPLCPPPAG